MTGDDVAVEQTPLPGIGMRYELPTATGRRLGLVVHRDGNADLLVYDAEDPDAAMVSVSLEPHERAVLAELLAVPPGEDAAGRTRHRVWQLSEELQ
jgi:TrkA domain protein